MTFDPRFIGPGGKIPFEIKSLQDVYRVMRRANETLHEVTKGYDSDEYPFIVHSKEARQIVARCRTLEDAITFASAYKMVKVLMREINRVKRDNRDLRQTELFPDEGDQSVYHKSEAGK